MFDRHVKVLLLSVVAVLVWCAIAAFGPAPGRCAWCYPGPCFNSTICGRSCVCMKQGSNPEGSCVSFSR